MARRRVNWPEREAFIALSPLNRTFRFCRRQAASTNRSESTQQRGVWRVSQGPAVWRYAARAVEPGRYITGRPVSRQAGIVHEQSMTDPDQEFLFYLVM
jgi:hypothetical protein